MNRYQAVHYPGRGWSLQAVDEKGTAFNIGNAGDRTVSECREYAFEQDFTVETKEEKVAVIFQWRKPD